MVGFVLAENPSPIMHDALETMLSPKGVDGFAEVFFKIKLLFLKTIKKNNKQGIAIKK